MFEKGNRLGEVNKGQQRGRKEITWRIDDNGCWICTSHAFNTYGYAQTKFNGKIKLIHRLMYENKYGEIPKGMCACHKCDNPNCINPRHIFVGTNKDNSEDMVQKRRQSHIGSPGMKGVNHPQSKLIESDVIKIMNEKTLNQKQLSLKYGVSQAVISKIRLGQSWKHLQRSEL